MTSSQPGNRTSTPPPQTTSPASRRSSSTATVFHSAAAPPSLPRLRRETRSVASSSMRAASCQQPVEEDVEVGSSAGVATSGVPASPLLGEGEGEGEETGSDGVATAEQAPRPPPYPQDEAEIPVAAAAADVEEDDEEYDDEPPDFFLVEADAETLFGRGVRLLQLTHNNINELDQVNGLAGGLPGAVEARRNLTIGEAEIRQAFTTVHREFDRHNARRAELADQLMDLNTQLRQELHGEQVLRRRQRDRADAAHQLRNNLELMVHQAHNQIRQQRIEVLEAAPGIQQLWDGREMAAADANRWEEAAQRLRVQNAQLQEEIAAMAAGNARDVRQADQIHAELHRWQRMAVRLNNERTPEGRYDLPNIAHQDEVNDPALQFEVGHEFDVPPPPAPPPSPAGDDPRQDQENRQVDGIEGDRGTRYQQPRVEDYPVDVDSDAETVVGEDSR
jgi:hypothetical protein